MFKVLKRVEIISVLVILAIVFLANFVNFKISERKARDTQRDLDVSAIALGLEKYYKDYGYYPQSSSNGKIIACEGAETKIERDKYGKAVYIGKNKPKLVNLIPCEWGKDSLMDVTDTNYPHYLSVIPKDPQDVLGASYLYISDGAHFQILGAFEGKDQPGYSQAISERAVSCGIHICNFGKASKDTVLEKSL